MSSIRIARTMGCADAEGASPPQANPTQLTGAPHGYSAGRFLFRPLQMPTVEAAEVTLGITQGTGHCRALHISYRNFQFSCDSIDTVNQLLPVQ